MKGTVTVHEKGEMQREDGGVPGSRVGYVCPRDGRASPLRRASQVPILMVIACKTTGTQLSALPAVTAHADWWGMMTRGEAGAIWARTGNCHLHPPSEPVVDREPYTCILV
jgi:hypothetical protein